MKKENLLKNVIFAIMIFLLFNYSWIFQLVPVILFNLNVENISDKSGVFLNAFSTLTLAIILLFIYKDNIIKEFKILKTKFWNNFDIGVKNWFIGLFFMIIFNLVISKIFSGGQSANETAVQNMIRSVPWLMLITAGFLAPLTEEIVFRKSIRNIFSNRWLYILTSGVLFGLAHVLGNITSLFDLLYVLPYGSLGCAFAASYYDTDTIFTPIIFHMIHNIVLVILSII